LNFWEFVKNDIFVNENCKNHGRDALDFLITSPILAELLGHKIPHFKAHYQFF
jgi:hypothetical protein